MYTHFPNFRHQEELFEITDTQLNCFILSSVVGFLYTTNSSNCGGYIISPHFVSLHKIQANSFLFIFENLCCLEYDKFFHLLGALREHRCGLFPSLFRLPSLVPQHLFYQYLNLGLLDISTKFLYAVHYRELCHQILFVKHESTL